MFAGALCRRHAGNHRVLFDGTPARDEYLIVNSGALAGTGAKSYKLT
jgi:formate dehydrogenase